MAKGKHHPDDVRLMRKHMALARRGKGLRRKRAKPNPSSSLGTAFTWLGGGALVGGGIGAVAAPTNRAVGALGGAMSGVTLVSVVGFGVGVFSPRRREAGFYTAAVGLGGLIALGLVTSIVAPTAMVGMAGVPPALLEVRKRAPMLPAMTPAR